MIREIWAVAALSRVLLFYSNDTYGSYLDSFPENFQFSFRLYGIFAIVHTHIHAYN